MTSYKVALSDTVISAINAAKAGYVLPDLDVARAWIPWARREDLEAAYIDETQDPPVVGAKCYVIPMTENARGLTRRNAVLYEIPLQVSLQAPLTDHQDVSQVDLLIELEEQISATVRSVAINEVYSWNRMETIQDENGLPYDFTKLRDEFTYECYRIHHFQYASE